MAMLATTKFKATSAYTSPSTEVAAGESVAQVPSWLLQSSRAPRTEWQKWPFNLIHQAGTPAAIVARLNADIGKALAEPAIRANLVQSAQEPIGGTPEAFGVRVREDFEKYGRLVQELNIKVAR
jgi:hypothetical protein